MKKNLFEESVSEQIINRAARLTNESLPLWGTMTAGEMLRHCSVALAATLSTPNEVRPTTIKQKISRFLMLNVIPTFPKGAKTPHPLNMKKNNITVEALANELENFNTHVHQFVQHQQPVVVSHPYFGRMSRKQWGIVTWMHLDHHLRQFGV